jgi:hypothetical protein
MNRRAFLGLSSAALAAYTLDPERALWVPGQRSYFDIVRPDVFDLKHDFHEYFLDWETVPGMRSGGQITISGFWVPSW